MNNHFQLFRIIVLAILSMSSSMVTAQVMEITDEGEMIVVSAPVATITTTPTRTEKNNATATTPPLRWRDAVANIAAKYQISPALLSALVWQESRWQTDAVSPAGALGLTQLMPATARYLGVDPNKPLENLEGGARYLREQLNRFGGDIEKALAAYNAGPARVIAANGVPRITETRNYVNAILAALANHEVSVTALN